MILWLAVKQYSEKCVYFTWGSCSANVYGMGSENKPPRVNIHKTVAYQQTTNKVGFLQTNKKQSAWIFFKLWYISLPAVQLHAFAHFATHPHTSKKEALDDAPLAFDF